MTPTTALNVTTFESPLGPIWIVADNHGLAGLWFHDQKHLPSEAERARWIPNSAHPMLLETIAQLKTYFQGGLRVFELPLSPVSGTHFQRSVWLALQHIPFGETSSYGALAHNLGNPKAVRAVGSAVGRNPWSIVVPCHRVLGADGALTGYAGGLQRKAALLDLEQPVDLLR